MKITIHEFNKSIRIGQQGEKYLFNKLEQYDKIKIIRDVSNDSIYRKCDIDFIATMYDKKVLKLEIKTDTYDSGNIFYETVSSNEVRSNGCMLKTKADMILYFFEKTNELYILNTKEFIDWINKNTKKFKRVSLKNMRYDGSHYTTEGLLVNKNYLEANFKSFLKILLDRESIKLLDYNK